MERSETLTLRITDGLEHPFYAAGGVAVREWYGSERGYGCVVASFPPFRVLGASCHNARCALPGRDLEEYRGRDLGAYGRVRKHSGVEVRSATGKHRAESWVREVQAAM